MRDWFVGAFVLTLAVSSAGCGGSGQVDFFQANGGRANSVASGGNVSSASAGSASASGGSAMNAGGSNAAGTTSAGSAGMPSGPSDAPCSPATEGMNQSSGSFGTLGESCWRVSMDIAGWGCNNIDGRTIKVNGTTVKCGELPLPDKVHGDYYFDFSAGEFDYASFYWF